MTVSAYVGMCVCESHLRQHMFTGKLHSKQICVETDRRQQPPSPV